LRLDELTKGLSARIVGDAATDVDRVCYDSRKAGKGAIFAAIKGVKLDGRDYMESAVSNGAVCVLTDEVFGGVAANVAQIIVPDVRAALAVISERLSGEPASRLVMAGITGTNGKTTTTYLVESVLREAGFEPGVIGTVNYRYAGRVFSAPHTTPEAPEISALLKEMVDAGATHCVMEVSSHALAQKRADGCRFKAAAFTNLTHEHLDYHRTMGDYFAAKTRLFSELLSPSGVAVINIDDAWGRRLSGVAGAELTYSALGGADIAPVESRLDGGGMEVALATPLGEILIKSTLAGEYNLQNVMAAVGVSIALGVDADAISRGIGKLRRVPGRLDRVDGTFEDGSALRAYVDYAHTPDALERVIAALRKVTAKRLITVFGCGGDRDRTKRPEMGEISGRLSDVTIVTSDNPRSEDPAKIINDIEAGLSGVPRAGSSTPTSGHWYATAIDRREAIELAVRIASPGDAILVAGKGHEDYQIVGSEKFVFDDAAELRKAMDRRRAGCAGVH
jgi:UDP-N-acetylmuramoyl-L-alanyl-D-glutamate--2,6-diaminopimelate ligase